MLNSLGSNKNRFRFIYVFFSLLLCLSISTLTLAQENSQNTTETSRKRRVSVEDPVFSLGQDSSFDQKLEVGQNHNYQISLKQGQYLSLAISKKDFDIIATLFDPNDKKLIEIFSSNRPHDPEIGIYLLIEISGTYRLTITAKNPQLTASYAIKTKELRLASKQDKERISNQAAYDEAEKLRLQNTKESMLKAFNIYMSLLPIWRQLGDSEGEAATLNAISAIYFANAQYKESLQNLEQALKIWRELNNSLWEVATLTSLGAVCNLNKDNRQALYYYLKAQQVANKLNDPQWLAFTFNGLGKVCLDLAELDQSLNYYQQALAIKRKLLDKRGEAISLSNIANVYASLQNYQSSLDYHLESLAVFSKIGDVSGEASTLNNIGRSYMLLNDYDKALDAFKQALKKKQDLQDLRGEATTFNNIGYLYVVSSEQKNSAHFTSSYFKHDNKQKALDAFKQALEIWRKINDRFEEQTTLVLMAKTYTALGDQENADKVSQQVIAIENIIKSNKDLSSTNTTIANTSNKTSEPSNNNTSSTSNEIALNPPSSTNLPKLATPDISELPARSKKSNEKTALKANTNPPTKTQIITNDKLETATKVETAKVETAKVETAKVETAKEPSTSISSSSKVEKGKFSIQVGAMSKKEEADAVCSRLRSNGLDGYVAEGVSAGKTVFRVRMGHFESMEEAKKAAIQLKAKGAIGEYFIATQ